MSKTIQEILDEQRQLSPLKDLSSHSISVSISNQSRKGLPASKEPWNKGKTGLQAAWNKGQSPDEETRQKMSDSQKKNSKRKPHSAETRALMADKASMRKKSQEERAKISAKKKKPVMAEGIRFDSRKAAADHFGITPEGLGVRMKYHPEKYYYIKD
jgi:hypothetical protein